MRSSIALVSLVSLFASSVSFAEPVYQCDSASETRTVAIVYENTEASVPCRVDYTKNDSVQTLWRAENEAGYCEDKAQAFLDKLVGWGFSCSEQTGATQ